MTSSDYLTLTITHGSGIIIFNCNATTEFAVPGVQPTLRCSKTISCSRNGGDAFTITSMVTSGPKTDTSTGRKNWFVVTDGDIIRIWGLNNSYGINNDFIYSHFTTETEEGEDLTFTLGGNIMSLVYGGNFQDKKELPENGSFFRLFYDCKGLTEINDLFLPCENLPYGCYEEMFKDCKDLTDVNIYSSTNIKCGSSSFKSMFDGCENLTVNNSYFLDDNSIISKFSDFTCSNMFRGCKLIGPSINIDDDIQLNNVRYCFQGCFNGCSGPNSNSHVYLPSTLIGVGTYKKMFKNNTNLNNIICLATDVSSDECTTDWVDGVAENGTFLKKFEMNSWERGVNGIPINWNVEDYASISLIPQTLFFPNDNDQKNIEVKNTTGIPWTASTSDNWITLSDTSSTEDDIFVTITVVPFSNTGTLKRTGTISFTNGQQTKILNIIQEEYLTFKVLSNGKICWKASSSSNLKSLRYSKNNGTWTNLTSSLTGSTINVNSGDIVRFKGYNSVYGDRWLEEYNSFSDTTCMFNVEGNISTIINNGDNYGSIENYSLAGLFGNCTGLTDASKLVLPATILGKYCYQYMFSGCTSLVSAPSELPAMTLANNCYYEMFSYCTSLVNVPSLPATSLGEGCYYEMFRSCESLTTAPNLPATTLADSCYYGMFNSCTSLVNAPQLPALSLVDDCYNKMFYNCSSLVNAPELPSETLAFQCYSHMFQFCTSLVNAPELPATSLADSCYGGMFYGCTSLVSGPSLPSRTLANGCYAAMFNSCTSLINAPSLPATSLTEGCYYEMFNACTSLLTAPILPSRTLVSKCYYGMFQYCNKLNYIKCLATNIPEYGEGDGCTENWVDGVSLNGTFVKYTSMTGWTTGINGIPNGWSIQNATS